MRTPVLSKADKYVLFIVVCSLLLRVYIVLQGGQYLWPDELRYRASQLAIQDLFSGQWYLTLQNLFGAGTYHIGFMWVGLFPAIIEYFIGADPKIPALFCATISVANLIVMYRLATSLFSRELEGLLAVFFLAISTSFFYWSRHILNYDTAILLCLLSLMYGLKMPIRNKGSFLCGFFSSAAFLVYPGYWILEGFCLAAHFYTLYYSRSKITTSFFSIAGFAVPLLFITTGSAIFKSGFWAMTRQNTYLIQTGVHAEGWSLPFNYLWHTEHGLFLFWCFVFVVCCYRLFQRKLDKLAALWVWGILFVYANLFVFSTILHKFTVQGRTVRQFIPLFCILGSYWLAQYCNKRGKVVGIILCSLLIVQAGLNFHKPLIQNFPNRFTEEALAMVPANAAYSLLYVKSGIFPDYVPLPPLPPHQVIYSAAPPMKFIPYLLEGFFPPHRKALLQNDINMRLIIYNQVPEKKNAYLSAINKISLTQHVFCITKIK